MSIKQIDPYILHNGTGEKAIKLYQSALGAEIVGMMRYGDGQGCNALPEHKDFIMHAALRIGDGSIMISDVTPDRAVTLGGNVEIAMHFTEVPGMDAYGVRWMFNCEL